MHLKENLEKAHIENLPDELTHLSIHHGSIPVKWLLLLPRSLTHLFGLDLGSRALGHAEAISYPSISSNSDSVVLHQIGSAVTNEAYPAECRTHFELLPIFETFSFS
jgi:hypothetical protein